MTTPHAEPGHGAREGPADRGRRAMAHDSTHDRPDYGKIRAVGAFASQDFAEATEADEAAVNERTDIASNELHAAAGKTCARCHRPLEAGTDVRRTVAGEYEHERCPIVLAET